MIDYNKKLLNEYREYLDKTTDIDQLDALTSAMIKRLSVIQDTQKRKNSLLLLGYIFQLYESICLNHVKTTKGTTEIGKSVSTITYSAFLCPHCLWPLDYKGAICKVCHKYPKENRLRIITKSNAEGYNDY